MRSKGGKQRTPEETDKRIIRSLGRGAKTLYRLSRKPDKLPQSTLSKRLPYLEASGFIRGDSKGKWRTGLETKDWVLTLKGFVRFLRDMATERTNEGITEARNDIKLALAFYASRLMYQPVGSKKTRPFLPTFYSLEFRKQLGDQEFLDLLVRTAVITYAQEVGRYDWLLANLKKTRETQPIFDVLRMPPGSKDPRQFQEQRLAEEFEKHFLWELLPLAAPDRLSDAASPFHARSRGHTRRGLRIPDVNLRDYSKELLETAISEHKGRLEQLTRLLEWTGHVFDPTKDES